MNKFEFYINKYYFIKSEERIDTSQIPPITRRRLSLLDKAAFTTLNRVYENNVKSIVYTSQKGECARLDKIINQYLEYNEVSPAQFSASVHNFPVGFFTLQNKLNIPYYAMASGKNSISAGIIKSVISKVSPVLFCYADSDVITQSVACTFSKEYSKDAIKCVLSHKKHNVKDEFNDFIAFLENKQQIFKGGLCEITRAD